LKLLAVAKRLPLQSWIFLLIDYNYTYKIINILGQEMDRGNIPYGQTDFAFDLENYMAGYYFIHLTDNKGVIYKIKCIKHDE
jgi:hypothetical protein